MRKLFFISVSITVTLGCCAQSKSRNFELDGSYVLNPQTRPVNGIIQSTYGPLPFTISGATTGGASVSLSYRIRLGKHFALIPGISCLFFTQNTTTHATGTLHNLNFGTVSYFQESETNKINYNTLAPTLGLRWQYKKFNFENGVGMICSLVSTEKIWYSLFGDDLNGNSGLMDPELFFESYHKIGFDITRRFSVYAGVNLVYTDAFLFNGSDWADYVDGSRLKKMHAMPVFSLKVKL